ncbi:SwmB domain-containing protein [Caenimonas aquaedulcis]|uniref:Uncharacterized protein n=1 Tax=Caenimonas aquaedulcis TaxID=2793270 RepID=A0A931H4R7_9BURK|nr:SwmB domain-containing protein [Caenimonas aquaedulcis]MBG9388448.1 hypothetical protein [Caenimonas aquaedulcis]
MATTSQEIVLELVTGMFGAAPGKSFLDPLVLQLNARGELQLAIDLGQSTYFRTLYPTDQGGYAFANAFLSKFIPGFTVNEPAHLWALNWMADRIDHGVPAGQVVLEALQALENVPADNPTWGATLAQWKHWTDIAREFSVNDALSGSSLEQLQDALHAPVFQGADVDGATLVLHYADLNGLDAVNGPVAANFAVTVKGAARAVQTVAVDSAAHTVTLTLAKAVLFGDAVTVAYTDPTAADDAKAIQDSVGNDAASLAATAVTNNTVEVPDTTGPEFVSANIDGNVLVMTYDDAGQLDVEHPPLVGAFTVKVDGVAVAISEVQVNPPANEVILLLAAPVTDAQEVTIAYHDPSNADDAAALQDTLGNDAPTLAATDVDNITVDTTAPVFDEATIVGDTLVLSYIEKHALDADGAPLPTAFAVNVGGSAVAVDSLHVDAADGTVTLTLASAAEFGDAVTVAYTDPTGGNDRHALQDVAGNDAATLPATAVTNDTPDTAKPVFASASVNGATLVMTYTDATNLDGVGSHAPLPGFFAVKVAGVVDLVTAVSVNAAAKTVSLTLTTAATNGQVVTVAYTDPTSGNDTRAIQDLAGNDAASLAAHAVTNVTIASLSLMGAHADLFDTGA